MQASSFDNKYQHAIEAAIEAGKVIMEYYLGELHPEKKSDGSPVTEADKHSSRVIRGFLEQTNIPIIDEEIHNSDYQTRRNWTQCWLVDPLDGTMEFIRNSDEFSINIALVENNVPVFGLIASPVQEYMMFGGPDLGLFEWHYTNNSDIQEVNKATENGDVCRVISSKSYGSGEVYAYCENLRKTHKNVELYKRGSALKFIDLAKNHAQFYPRFGPTMEWDIAAGQAILSTVGGTVKSMQSGLPLSYNKTNLVNPHFIAKSAFV
jgi:3'(2'), 5'-bisphosphate nucleotidase